jgi:hypothetical protein
MGRSPRPQAFRPPLQAPRWIQWDGRPEMEPEIDTEMTLVPDEMTLVPDDMALPPDGLPPATCRSSPFVNWRSVSFLSASLRDADC